MESHCTASAEAQLDMWCAAADMILSCDDDDGISLPPEIWIQIIIMMINTSMDTRGGDHHRHNPLLHTKQTFSSVL